MLHVSSRYLSITHPTNIPPDKHVELINWTIIEPGLYLIAACALSFKPLFRMLATFLKLDSLLTHTRSFMHHATSKTAPKSGTTNSGLHLDPIVIKPTHPHPHHDGFQKLDSSRGDTFAENGKHGANPQSSMRVVVTTTVDMDVESNKGDDMGYDFTEARTGRGRTRSFAHAM